ncbi:HAMP domain-containing protein [Chryseolinea lacunae]|uniref:HAMP domain-containing protein n=1 Tax=Chryseolinea lacunae TaxID=2801331 RepID=A0ABS1KXR5_9BACT|nr:HAMP domain-containing protein [Chryseolinea lacunae]MBL0744189.1 hypothetical protein [Chryseolinea lacunae]
MKFLDVALTSGLFIAYYISSRIVKMANATAGGDYHVYINENGNSELNLLAVALNEMAKVLDENISQLKKQKDELDHFAHTVSRHEEPLRDIDNVVTWIEEDRSIGLPPKVIEYLTIIKGPLTGLRI